MRNRYFGKLFLVYWFLNNQFHFYRKIRNITNLRRYMFKRRYVTRKKKNKNSRVFYFSIYFSIFYFILVSFEYFNQRSAPLSKYFLFPCISYNFVAKLNSRYFGIFGVHLRSIHFLKKKKKRNFFAHSSRARRTLAQLNLSIFRPLRVPST